MTEQQADLVSKLYKEKSGLFDDLSRINQKNAGVVIGTNGYDWYAITYRPKQLLEQLKQLTITAIQDRIKEIDCEINRI